VPWVTGAVADNNRHRLIVLNPGHFHAALTLRDSHPRLSDDVHVYADDGPDVDGFLKIVTSFNERKDRPTHWRLHVTRGHDHFDRLLGERPGDVAIVAGRNDSKMSTIARLHAAGFSVLGDKPWLISADALPLLQAATAGPPLVMDIMTERHSIEARLLRSLVADAAVFGDFRTDGSEPAIEMRGVHHLYKIVNHAPLIRPAWYFDTAVQGQGIFDVTTHQVDLAQWLVGDGTPYNFDRDVELLAAEQWPTAVPLDLFRKITGLNDFPETLAPQVTDLVLQYVCNAGIRFCLRSVPVEIESHWDLAVPDGGGDLHRVTARGTRCDIVSANGPETGFVTQIRVRPGDDMGSTKAALRRRLDALQTDAPGVDMRARPDGFEILIPARLVTGHEAHFAAVLDQFLGYVDAGDWPVSLGPDLVTKYTLLARARSLSLGESR
jgi:predicted dehydrogenase